MKWSITTLITGFISAGILLCGCRYAKMDRPEYEAAWLPVGVDPAPDSSFWEKVPAYRLGPLGNYVQRNPVWVQFAYCPEALYFRFDAVDDDLVDEAPEKLSHGFYLFADAIELFLQPFDEHGYWEFHFIPSGRCGAIFFPSRGRRMPSCVNYLPMEGLNFRVICLGTVNDMNDKDRRWLGVARIPFSGLNGYFPDFRPGDPLRVQVTNVAYSVYADADEKNQLNHTPGKHADPHYLPDWGVLRFSRPPDHRL